MNSTATFSNLVFNSTGPYTLTASGTGAFTITSNSFMISGNTAATVTGVSSTTANGTYGVGASIGITVSFSKAVTVTGAPTLALNSGGTAMYMSGSGTSALTFLYTVASGQNNAHLDYTSTGALSLNGGTILDSSSTPAVLTLPAPGGVGSLGANSNLVIDTTAPVVISYSVLFGSLSYNLTGSPRNRLPWQITGIQVLFSKPIVSGNAASLGGVSASGLSGLGTGQLTWTISPLTVGSFSTTLAGTGVNALKDAAGNALAGGAGFNQTIRVLYGDYNDDGFVNAADMTSVNLIRSAGGYNIFADINGDTQVTIDDVQIIRTRIGTTLP